MRRDERRNTRVRRFSRHVRGERKNKLVVRVEEYIRESEGRK